MKLRTHLLAGLIAAAAVPGLAHATPYVGLGERQQSAQLGQANSDVPRESRSARAGGQRIDHGSRHIGLGELQQRGQLGRGSGGDGASTEFFTEHQRAMNVGVSHIEASQIAARSLAKASAN